MSTLLIFPIVLHTLGSSLHVALYVRYAPLIAGVVERADA